MSDRAELLKEKLKTLGMNKALKSFEKLEGMVKSQAIYDICLKDTQLRCTCDEVLREGNFFQAQGHYHHCMLWQVTRAIELSLMYSEGYRLIDGKMCLSGKELGK
jgi:hypothetical protein